MRTSDYTTCYHCDAGGTSREHVPPKCLFPKDGNWDRLLTVPSCAVHNNATSRADEYLKFLLCAAASGSPSAIVASAVRGAIRQAVKRSHNLHRYGYAWEGGALDIGRVFHVDYELLSESLAKMTRALYFHHHGGRKKLTGELHAWPTFIGIKEHNDPRFLEMFQNVRKMTAREFAANPKLGDHQDIFAYQVIEAPETILVIMEFYGVHQASVVGLRM